MALAIFLLRMGINLVCHLFCYLLIYIDYFVFHKKSLNEGLCVPGRKIKLIPTIGRHYPSTRYYGMCKRTYGSGRFWSRQPELSAIL